MGIQHAPFDRQIVDTRLLYYRPQTKLQKGYVFTPVSHSIHRRGGLLGVCPSACWDTPPGRYHPGQTPRTDTPCADTPRGRHPPADGYCCGRYASYWNTFLLFFNCCNLFSNDNVLFCEKSPFVCYLVTRIHYVASVHLQVARVLSQSRQTNEALEVKVDIGICTFRIVVGLVTTDDTFKKGKLIISHLYIKIT